MVDSGGCIALASISERGAPLTLTALRECLCEGWKVGAFFFAYTHTHIYIYIYEHPYIHTYIHTHTPGVSAGEVEPQPAPRVHAERTVDRWVRNAGHCGYHDIRVALHSGVAE
jgi:hypothetical protein